MNVCIDLWGAIPGNPSTICIDLWDVSFELLSPSSSASPSHDYLDDRVRRIEIALVTRRPIRINYDHFEQIDIRILI
jgi:hypothetical protein